MSRRPRPWYRHDPRRPDKCGWWVHVGGRLHLLHRGTKSPADRKIAEDKFHELMLMAVSDPESPDATVASLCESFLGWSRRRQSPETVRGYAFYLQKFSEACGYRLVSELKPYHVSRWLDEQTRWNATSRYNGIRAALRVFNWGKDEGLIAVNPVHGIKRPKPLHRTRYMTDEEFAALRAAACPAFRRFLVALEQTGARPSEVRSVRWEDWHEDRWILRQHKTAAQTGVPRVIYLSERMQRMLRKLQRHASSPYIFVNTRGKPWTRNATRLQLSRLKRKLNLADDLCLYLARHRFGTKAAMRGLNASTIAELMGHSSVEMIGRVYVHLAGEANHLQRAVEQATSPPRVS